MSKFNLEYSNGMVKAVLCSLTPIIYELGMNNDVGYPFESK